MPRKLISVLSAAVFMSAVAFTAHAADKLNYDAKSFAAAQAAGKPILVEIHATWCPTCKAQEPILSDLEKQDKFKNPSAKHADHVQGLRGNRPLRWRYEPEFDCGLARQDDLMC